MPRVIKHMGRAVALPSQTAIADAIDTLREVRYLVIVSHPSWYGSTRVIEAFAPTSKKAQTAAKAIVRNMFGMQFTRECHFNVSSPWWSVNGFRKGANPV